MTLRNLSRTFIACIGATLMAACSTQQSLPVSSAQSYLAGAGKRNALLYVIGITKSGNDYVYVFKYPSYSLSQVLGPIFGIQGICVDDAGDIFLTAHDSNKGTVAEYPPGGSKPAAIFHDTYGPPLGCTVDPKTGNLAVTNTNVGKRRGSLVIYEPRKQKPMRYADPSVFSYDYATYDTRGNLYVDGHTGDGDPVLEKLPSGGADLIPETLSKSVGSYPTNLAWNNAHLVIGTQYGRMLYRVRVSGSSAKVVGRTKLLGCRMLDYFIADDSVLVLCSADLFTYKYPAGGRPQRVIKRLERIAPIGFVLSV
jgi:hypothetical protein